MTRKQALVYMQIAGYHGDTKRFTRLTIESRISKPVANGAFEAGVKMKQTGVKCGCADCAN
jgi:hypothetical protein